MNASREVIGEVFPPETLRKRFLKAYQESPDTDQATALNDAWFAVLEPQLKLLKTRLDDRIQRHEKDTSALAAEIKATQRLMARFKKLETDLTKSEHARKEAEESLKKTQEERDLLYGILITEAEEDEDGNGGWMAVTHIEGDESGVCHATIEGPFDTRNRAIARLREALDIPEAGS